MPVIITQEQYKSLEDAILFSLDKNPVPSFETSPSYRSGELRTLAHYVFPPFEGFDLALPERYDESMKNALNDLIAVRRSLVENKDHRRYAIPQQLWGSTALLLFDWTRSLDNGSSGSASRGYLDQSNFPPWDTWVAITENPENQKSKCLLSFVPPAAQHLVNDGILVDLPARSLSWAEIMDDGTLHYNGFGKGY